MTGPDPQSQVGHYTPLYEAQNSARYQRQALIRDYQATYQCRLIVVSSPNWADVLRYFEELIHDSRRDVDLHVMLTSAGGDGETALRMVRSAQARCRELVVVLPDQAKSAATLFTLGAHRILMGPFGDLGPVDPQVRLDAATWVSAKDIIASVEDASARIEAAPASYPFWASLFSNLNGITVQQARTAIDRTSDQLKEALAAHPGRTESEVTALLVSLKEKLIDAPKSHAAVFGASDALKAGLPVEELDPDEGHWHDVWRIWSRYAVMGNLIVYEGERASQIMQLDEL